MTASFDIAVIGAGAIGQTLAVDLARRGFSVSLLVERAGQHAEALRMAGQIRLSGHIGEAVAPMPPVVADARAAAASPVILVATTVDAHRQVALDLAPVLGDEHVVLLANGYVNGSARFTAALCEGGCGPACDPELNTTPYLVCSPEPGRVHVTARKTWMELTASESGLAEEHHTLLAGLIPGIGSATMRWLRASTTRIRSRMCRAGC